MIPKFPKLPAFQKDRLYRRLSSVRSTLLSGYNRMREGCGECPLRLKSWHVCTLVVIALCLVILISSVVVLLLLSSIIENFVRQGSALVEDGDLLRRWTHPQYAIQSKMSVFSVRNPDDILHNNSVPNVRMEGPYAFDQVQHFNEWLLLSRLSE
jgi:CD36 family